MHARVRLPSAGPAAAEREADDWSRRVLHATAPLRSTASPGRTAAPASALLPGAGRALSRGERAFMEPRFGADFGSVRVHDDARAQRALDRLDARGMAHGEHVALERGAGAALLAHELAHVLQQRQGGARPQFEGKAKQPAAAPGVDPKFWEWWKRVVGFEGPLDAWKANPANAADKGGETNFGVTKNFYLQWAQALGLPATEEGFAALTPEQAMRFGQMAWKSSGASRIANTGVAIVIADWYWGGIHLKRLTALLAKRGFKATYDKGSPSKATTDFINTLPPDELVQEMSDAKAEQYNAIAKADPSQQVFRDGWLKRNEERRAQAQPFVAKKQAAAAGKPVEQLSLWERGQRALRLAARAESPPERDAADAALADAIEAIESQAERGFAHAEEKVSMNALRDELVGARRELKGG